LLPELWVIGYGVFHIVVLILQYTCENQAKKQEPTFISSTRRESIACIDRGVDVRFPR